MGRFVRFLCILFVAKAVVPAETLGPSVSTACAQEISVLHGAWLTPQVNLPVYADWETVAYLAGLSVRAAGNQRPTVAVLPVYAAEPIHFRRGAYVFVSTGLILGASGEPEVVDAIRAELPVRRIKKPLAPSACAPSAFGAPASFPEIRQRLVKQVAEYAESARRRLKRREVSEWSPSPQ